MRLLFVFFISIFCQSLLLEASNIVVREPNAALDKYYQYLRQNIQNQTPMDYYESYYKKQPVPENLLKTVEQFKFDGSQDNFETFKSLAFQSVASSEKKNFIIYLKNKYQIPKQAPWNQIGLIQKVKQWRRLPGGEDLALFIDGVRWMEDQELETNVTYQWTLLSSSWAPIHFNGCADQFINQSLEPIKYWINGDQNHYDWNTLDLLIGHQRQIFWGLDQITWDNGLEKHLIFQEQKIESEFIKSKWTWLGAVALGLLWHQHSQNKQLIISF